MPSKVLSCALIGLESTLIEIEADVTQTQLGNFIIVGLPDTAVQESRERIRLAIKNAGFQFPTKRISVNLAPADIKKQGPCFDVPIALAIMLATQKNPVAQHIDLEQTIMLGELALDGSVRAISGVLPMLLTAKQAGLTHAVVPAANKQEASLVQGMTLYPIAHVKDLLESFLTVPNTSESSFKLRAHKPQSVERHVPAVEYDMAQINGQLQAKRVLEIAAAGGHNVLMKGPPGSGKTMLARALPGILPPLEQEEALEVTAIYSASGKLKTIEALLHARPFRAPHHTASGASLIGGGTWPTPGEVSFAHKGVLFLDEFPEFPRAVLEYLRQPLEEGAITVSRSAGTWTFPAECMLVAAMNPCPCGFHLDDMKPCVCAPGAVTRYQQRLSGPLLDRIDLFVSVPRVGYETLTSTSEQERSHDVQARVIAARALQYKRFGSAKTNARMSAHECKQYCVLDAKTNTLLKQAVDSLQLSARSYYRLLRLSRTIADLEGDEVIEHKHVAESLQYRWQ